MKRRLQTTQTQRQKARMKPLRVAIAVTALTGLLVTVLIIVFSVGAPQDSTASGTCTSCDYTIDDNFTGSYTVNNGKTLCISSTGIFTCSITLKNKAILCNNGIFEPSSVSGNNKGEIINHNIATFPSNFSYSADITNTGIMSFNGNFTNRGTFNNSGQIALLGNFTNSSSGGTNLTSSNSFTITGNFTNQSLFENNGFFEVGGSFDNSSSGNTSFPNNDSLFVGGVFNNSNDFLNNGGAMITGNFNNNNTGAASLENTGVMIINGNLVSHQLVDNSGRLFINGDMTMSNSGSTRTVNDSVFVVHGDLTANNIVTNNSYFQVNGIYTNMKWSGKILVGPGSMLEVDSLMNEHIIENNNTPYGQIVVGSYLNNSGTISTYVDICKSDNSSAFDENTGSVDEDVTYCVNNTPLPVELLAFTTKKTEGVVLLEWSTASELNNRLFEVQRRIENGRFEVIAEVAGAGNSQTLQEYQYVDAGAVPQKINYYRLRQVDYDGEYAYSSIAVLQDKAETPSLTNEVNIYPNPVNRQEPLRVELNGEWLDASYQVQNMSGNITLQGAISSGGQIATNNLKPGIYLVKIYNETDSRTTKVIVR
ncbi:MAG: T9SS type A sorting domain-containing protein [Bacteroidia bacterium]